MVWESMLSCRGTPGSPSCLSVVRSFYVVGELNFADALPDRACFGPMRLYYNIPSGHQAHSLSSWILFFLGNATFCGKQPCWTFCWPIPAGGEFDTAGLWQIFQGTCKGSDCSASGALAKGNAPGKLRGNHPLLGDPYFKKHLNF